MVLVVRPLTIIGHGVLNRQILRVRCQAGRREFSAQRDDAAVVAGCGHFGGGLVRDEGKGIQGVCISLPLPACPPSNWLQETP